MCIRDRLRGAPAQSQTQEAVARARAPHQPPRLSAALLLAHPRVPGAVVGEPRLQAWAVAAARGGGERVPPTCCFLAGRKPRRRRAPPSPPGAASAGPRPTRKPPRSTSSRVTAAPAGPLSALAGAPRPITWAPRATLPTAASSAPRDLGRPPTPDTLGARRRKSASASRDPSGGVRPSATASGPAPRVPSPSHLTTARRRPSVRLFERSKQ